QFDNQLLVDTTEVDDVRRDKVLPSELEVAQAAGAQVLPQLAFGVGGFAAHVAGPLQGHGWQWWFDSRHFALPSPLPLSRGERRSQRDLQHPALHLFALDALEQRLEVAFAEAFVALALDDLEEDLAERVLGEDLQQLALLGFRIGVDQDPVAA